MATTVGEDIKFIDVGDGENHPIDALYFNEQSSSYYQLKSRLVTSVDSSSTDTDYPSANCVYKIIGDLDALKTYLESKKTN